MLTKELIRCRTKNKNLLPDFIDCSSPELLNFAGRLLEIYRNCLGTQRENLEEQITPLRKEFPDLVFAKALVKLLEDRSEYSTAADLDYFHLRQEIFLQSAKLYQSQTWKTPDELKKNMLSSLGGSNPLLAGGTLYADLPDHDILVKFRDLTPRQLLERYNVGQVQGLLLTAGKLELNISTDDPQKLRRLFKYLRFFRLLAKISCKTAPAAGELQNSPLELEIAGPASILEQSHRYGLQLACFFPAVCSLSHWSLRAEVTWRNQPRLLQLDENSPLVCPYHNFSAYVPDEIHLFHRHFKETVQDWEITGETPFLRGPGTAVIFPDLSFRRGKKEIVHLELFHRWHQSNLLPQLKWLEKQKKLPLIIGIDRYLITQNPELASFLENSAWFAERGFTFKDYPSVQKTLNCLKRIRKQPKTTKKGSHRKASPDAMQNNAQTD